MSENAIVRLVRRVSFSAAVHYRGPSGGSSGNYGSLSRYKGLGFNYRLEAHVEGEVDPFTGMIVNLVDIDAWLKSLTNDLDHRVLNDLPAFGGLVPTAERIVLHCLRKLEEKVATSGAKARVVKVRLYEGDGLWVDAFGA